MTILEINPENISKEVSDSFRVRNATRAILLDNNQNIALLHARKHGYHKLPGGGIEDGESGEEALVRECLEETGCSMQIGTELGSIVEYRGEFNLKQISQCFIATVAGEKDAPSFTAEEIEGDFELIWVSINDAKTLLENDAPNDYEGKFIKERDSMFIKEAVKHL